MGLSLDAYKSLIVKLLPSGHAWQGENTKALVRAFASEITRASDAIELVFIEAIPFTTDQCLEDWERITGLPDIGLSLADTTQKRRQDVIARLIATGGQNKAYYIAIAASLGYDATITDNLRPFVAGSLAGERCQGIGWIFVFIVTVTGHGTPDERLEYLIRKYKPAHTVALFEWES